MLIFILDTDKSLFCGRLGVNKARVVGEETGFHGKCTGHQWWVLVFMGTCWIDLCQCLGICISCIYKPQKELSLSKEVVLNWSLGVHPVSTLYTYLGNLIHLGKAKAGVRRDLKWKSPTTTKQPQILVK